MISQEYSIAFAETIDILNHTDKEDVNKIPKKLLDFLKENMVKDYKPLLDFRKPLREMKLHPKTIGILSLIYKKYWCDNQKRKEFEEKLIQNEEKYQKELLETYDYKNIFEKNENKSTNHNISHIQENTFLIDYKSNKWYIKILDFFKSLFKRDKNTN